MKECPACYRGHLDQFGQCERCGVFVAHGAEPATAARVPNARPWKCRPDQDRVSNATEMLRTKLDRSV